MDKSFSQQATRTQKSGSFLGHLRIFDGMLNQLAGFVQLTEDEQKDAGIYLGNQYSRKYLINTTSNSSRANEMEKT